MAAITSAIRASLREPERLVYQPAVGYFDYGVFLAGKKIGGINVSSRNAYWALNVQTGEGKTFRLRREAGEWLRHIISAAETT